VQAVDPSNVPKDTFIDTPFHPTKSCINPNTNREDPLLRCPTNFSQRKKYPSAKSSDLDGSEHGHGSSEHHSSGGSSLGCGAGEWDGGGWDWGSGAGARDGC
jgi:hypothetical protein